MTMAARFPNAWSPHQSGLLAAVLKENRRYQSIRNPRLIEQYRLRKVKGEWRCSDELSQQTGGLTCAEMITLAEQASLRHALWTMGESIATLFEQVIERTPALLTLPTTTGPTWSEITSRWTP
ncbi:hypothetical protein GC176_20210 [bacterium]|nr:hypothetical protein [bacterium]